MNGFVAIDASVAVKWLVNEVYTDKAFELARSWAYSGIQPVAPYLMPVEVANVLYRRLLRTEISLTDSMLLIDGLIKKPGLSSETPTVFIIKP